MAEEVNQTMVVQKKEFADQPSGLILDRRRVLRWIGWGWMWLFIAAVFGSMTRFFFPRVLFEPPTKFKVGHPSEYSIGTPPFPSNFLDRNRIISGLSYGIIVIEAPYGSGALCTAQYAIEQNREVFVVPGMISQSNYAGSHGLIKSGASLVTHVNDIFESFNVPLVKKEKGKNINLTKNQQKVLNYIENDGNSLNVDKITELTRLEPHVVNQTIAFLVINGIIKEDDGKYYL